MINGGAILICDKPAIFASASQEVADIINNAFPRPHTAHLLHFLAWSTQAWSRVAKRIVTQLGSRRLRIHWMCNAEPEVSRLRIFGQRATHCHHNLYCSEGMFRILPEAKKTWDAVYIGAFVPYKRPWLAGGVQRLFVATRALPVPDERKREYGCEHAVLNERELTAPEVVEVLNQAWCGLALSAEEGGMVAATEYLLCGLPIVSTPSIGGRDSWFTSENHILVPAEKEAVAAAVESLVRQPRDPQAIRAEALGLLGRFRTRYVDYINNIAGDRVVSVEQMFAPGRSMYETFVPAVHLAEFVRSYDGSRFGARHLIGVDTVGPD